MESRSIKIKDYVTHERVPVRGDSHGNFTLSPLGFPFVNRSGYEPGLPPPTKFTAEMLVKPDLAIVKNGDIVVIDEKLAKIYIEYKDKFDFPRTDSDHDTFKVDAKLTSDGTGYQISDEHATFYAGCPVTIAVEDATYEAINGDYIVSSENYIIPPTVVSATGIACTVTFHPEQVETSAANPLFVKFTNNGKNNGIYKLIVSRTVGTGILYYTWLYKTSNAEYECRNPGEVTFDGTENDNVHDHYRNRVSDEEVADYLRSRLGAAIDCGKFLGAEYPVDAHGLLVKWFLGHGAIVHSIAGRTVVLDAFGHVIDTSGLGDCSGISADDDLLLSNIGQLHDWLMSTAGTNEYADYPSETPLTSDNNNITLNNVTSGERHTFVIQQDLANMVSAPPRKTFIHLPTALDLADGTEVELNVALPVVSQPNTVGQTDEAVKAALKSFTDYVSQPRVYILSGKQTPLPNNSVPNRGITTPDNSFTLLPKHPIDTDASTIAFGLYNRYECPKTFRFVGSLENTILNDGLVVDGDDYTVLFHNMESIPAQVGDSILLEYDVKTPIVGKVADIIDNTLLIDFGRELRMPYSGNDYDVEYNGVNCNAELDSGGKPQYIIDSISGVSVGDLLDFEVIEVHKEEKRIVSTKSSEDGIKVTFSSAVVPDAYNEIHGIVSTISVDEKFPYNRNTRKWTMYSKDATCMVDVRMVDAQDGLTEHTEDSGAFTNDSSSEPELIDNDSIIATIYPTSTNTFPWRLNGRNRIRHLGLTTNANVDYVSGGAKPLTRLVFEMNEGVYNALSGIYRGFHPMSELRYCEPNNNTAVGNSVLGSLLRVTLPSSLDADVDEEDKDNMYVVRRARKAFYDLIGDFKVARVGYTSTRDYADKKNTKWGDGTDIDTPTPDIDADKTDNLQRLNDWETKIIHLPNNCLGVDENLYRNLAYAGWNEYTNTQNFRIFYADDVDPFVESDGYGDDEVGNTRYSELKDDAGTTQRTVDPYLDIAEDDAPFNYTAENSVFKMFLPNPTPKTRNQYAAFVHGFLELPVIKRGLRSISWLTTAASEFDNRDMEPFYPTSHVMSTDGVAFPDVSRNALQVVAQSTDTDVKRALLAIPDKVAIYNNDDAKTLSAELISVNLKPETTNKEVVDYMKSLLTMYSNGMPLHLYDAHRAINVETADTNEPFSELLHAHEVTLYNDNASGRMAAQHKYCDLATAEGQDPEDVNMTYNLISDNDTDPDSAPLSLTTPLENVSSTFISSEFAGMYTRVHVKVMFSSALGRWIVKDYRQYPTCFLTPLYGAKTIDYTEKSYAYGNPKSYANRVPMSEGVENKKFSASKYAEACEEQPLWQLPCGAGSDYKDSLYKRYVEQPAMEMNPGCVPFLLESFPYDDEGKLNGAIKFRNLYESISTPMDANGDPKEDSVPEVNFWNIKLHIRPARSAYPGADIPSNSARTGGTIGEAMLGMFDDLPEEEEEPTEDNIPEVDENIFSE